MRRLLVATAAWALLFAAAAQAARLPVYRDPPKYKGVRRPPPLKPAEQPPLPPGVLLSSTGANPHVLVDDAGTAHIVWNEGRGNQDDATMYCRLKRGATACDGGQPTALLWNKTYGAGDGPEFNTDDGGPRIAQVGSQLVVLSKRYPTGSSRPDGSAGSSNTLAWTSSDGGSSWSPAQLIGTANMGQLAVVPGVDQSTLINSGDDPLCRADGAAGWCLEVFEPGQFGKQLNLSTRSNDNYYPGIALDETGRPIAIVENLDAITEVRRWNGNDPITDPANWPASNIGTADQPAMAGGPAGAFVMAKGTYNSGPFAVRRLSAGADGTVSAGPPTTVSDDQAQFAALAEDPSGSLHAAWQKSTYDGTGGVFIRNQAGGSFTPPERLNDGTSNGQIDIAATGDGGGFTVLNHTGGVTGAGEVWAYGFGNQAATGKPGLGDIAGGQGPLSNVQCQKVGFGKFDVQTASGCFFHGQGKFANVVVSDGEVTLDGLRIVPDPGTRIIIDPRALRIDTTGPVQVIVSNAQTGDIVLWHGEIHRDLSRVAPGSTLFEFPSQAFKANVLGFDVAADIPVKLEADGVHIPVDLALPPAFGGFTGHAELVANASGLQLSSLHIHVGPVPLGVLVIDNVDVAYSAGDQRWTGDGQLTVPAGGSIEAHFVFQRGDFVSANFGYTPNPAIAIGPFVYLLNVNGGFAVKPVQITAGAKIGAGAAVQGTAPVNVDGKFTMTFPTSGPADFKLTGSVNVFMFGIGNGFLDFQTDGYAAFGGHTGLDLGPLSVDANMDGFVDGTTGNFGADIRGRAAFCLVFDLPIKGETRICGAAKSEAAVSNAGFAVCARIDPPDPFGGVDGGVEFPWSDFNPAMLVNPVVLAGTLIDHIAIPCHAERYHSPPPRPVGARAAASGQIVAVKGGLPSETIQVDGNGGAPDVTVSGPGGAKFASAQPSPAGYAVQVEGVPATYVVLKKPRAGDWTVTANAGSVDISGVKVADGYAPASVTAKVKRGRIAYKIADSGHNQRVLFAEKGRFGTHVLGAVASARGTLRFKPAAGPGGKRTVVAMVQHQGVTTGTKTIGSYVAPGPAKPGKVRRLTARRSGTVLTVGWKAAKGAARYSVLVRGAKGTRVGRLVGAGTKQLRLPAMRRDEKLTVTVRALSKSFARGAPATAKVR